MILLVTISIIWILIGFFSFYFTTIVVTNTSRNIMEWDIETFGMLLFMSLLGIISFITIADMLFNEYKHIKLKDLFKRRSDDKLE